MIFSVCLFSQELTSQDLDNLVYANDLYKIQSIFEKDNLLLALGNRNDRYQILVKDGQSTLAIYDISDLGGVQGRIRLQDIWSSNDFFILSTSYGVLKLEGDTILTHEKGRDDLYWKNAAPFNLSQFKACYTTPMMRIGYQLVKSGYIKRKHDYPMFILSNARDSVYRLNASGVKTKDTYFDFKDWDIFYDRTDLFRPFIDVLTDSKVLFNFPGCDEAVLVNDHGEGLRLTLDQADESYQSTYYFASADARLILGVGYDGMKYQCYYYSKKNSKFIWFNEMMDQPLGIFSNGVYYRRKYEDTYYHYIKPFDGDKTSIIIDSIEFSY